MPPLITTHRRSCAKSAELNTRPRTTEMFIVSKNDGPTEARPQASPWSSVHAGDGHHAPTEISLHHVIANAGHREDTGYRGHTLEQQPVQSADLPRTVTAPAGVQRDLQQALGIEAHVQAHQVPQRLHEESGADQQEHRQANLAGHQRAAEAARALRRAVSVARSQGGREIDLRGTPRGSEPEQQRAQQRHSGGKAQDARVEPERQAFGRRRQGQHRKDDRDSPAREHQGKDAAQRGQHRALDQVLQDQPRPAGAERGAHRQLTPPRAVSHHQQVADIRAGNQQHQRDQSREREQWTLVLRAQRREPFARGEERDARGWSGGTSLAHGSRLLLRELTEKHLQRCLRL